MFANANPPNDCIDDAFPLGAVIGGDGDPAAGTLAAVAAAAASAERCKCAPSIRYIANDGGDASALISAAPAIRTEAAKKLILSYFPAEQKQQYTRL